MSLAAADAFTTYRKHPRPAAFAAVRAEVIRRILSQIPFGAKAADIERRMGLQFSKKDLYDLREGDTYCISDNRLFLWAERLEVPLEMRVG